MLVGRDPLPLASRPDWSDYLWPASGRE
ncbi:hypothetical protein CYA_1671 [Synechococcus sp. JA-3-3Ab]|nr:hypothetical protein CYA_1671 [Synechococcus sp. JA-3-3Ab]